MRELYLIALAGPIGAGKTEIARTIQQLVPNTFVVSFAMPVKKIARECFGWNGEKDERGRRLLQRIGTDCGRAYDQDIWARALMSEIFSSCKFDTAQLIVVDDLRFDNEAEAIRNHDGKIIVLEGRGAKVTEGVQSHASEAGISKPLVDFYVDNAGPKLETAVNVLRITGIADRVALRVTEVV